MENGSNENAKKPETKRVSVVNILILLAVFLILFYSTTGMPNLLSLHRKDSIYPYTKEGKLREATLNGSLDLNNGEYEKAIENFNLAIKINPDDPQLYHLRGLSYEKMNNFDKAIDDYNVAIKLSTGAVLYEVIISTQIYTETDTQIYTEALANAYLKKAKEYYKNGNVNDAIEYYDRGVKLNPKLLICTLPDFLKYMDEADKNFRKVLESAEKDQVASEYELLLAYLYMGDCKSAEEEYKKLMSEKIKEIGGEFYINIAAYLWKCKKNKNESIKYFEKGFQKGFNKFDELGTKDSYGRLIEGLNNQDDFKSLVNKYRKR